MFTFLESNTLSRKMKLAARMEAGLLEIKSKFDAEFRRFSIDLRKEWSLESFQNIIREVHKLQNMPFDLTYTDREGDLLPLNNEDNFHHALNISRPILRLVVQHKGTNQYGYNTISHTRKNIISRLLDGDHGNQMKTIPYKNISLPENFRCVSAIIDVDILPATQRRVKLIKSQSDKPLGFFVRDGYSIHPTATGKLERIPGIFISRLVPGGLAASTGLLAVNDEVLEVNGIEVAGKTLDQVTDMMVANSSNLIITIKPCNQFTNIKMNEDDEDDFSNLQVTKNNSNNVAVVGNNALMTVNDNANISDDDEDDVKDFVRQDPSGSSNTNSIGFQLQQQSQQQKQQILQQQQLQQLQQQRLLQQQMLQQQSQDQRLKHQQQNQLDQTPQKTLLQQISQNHQGSDSLNYNNNNNNVINFNNIKNNNNVINFNSINNNNNAINFNNNINNNSSSYNTSPMSDNRFDNYNRTTAFEYGNNNSFKNNSFHNNNNNNNNNNNSLNNSQRSKNNYNINSHQIIVNNNNSFNAKKPFRNDLKTSISYNSDLSLNSTINNNNVNVSNANLNNINNNKNPLRHSFKEYNDNLVNNNYNNNSNYISNSNNINKNNNQLNSRTKQQMIVTNLQSLNDLDDDVQVQMRFVEGGPVHSTNTDCNQFISSKSNDFYNFTNSSLRIIPNKYKNLNNNFNNSNSEQDGYDNDPNIAQSSFYNNARASSRSVDHHLMSRKKKLQL